MLEWPQNAVHQNRIVTEGKKKHAQVGSQRSYSLKYQNKRFLKKLKLLKN